MYEIFYHPSIGTHQSRPALVNFAGIVAIAAFYTPDDHYRHVIVATSDGNIREVFYHPSIGVHVSNPPLVNLPGVVALGAFYTPDDHYRHVIMGTSGYSGRDPVHADPWDFALDTEAGGATAWVAGDGGVFAFKNPTPYS
ncbi:MAG TPA: hypothetical protein VHT91_26205, partial [Kofleriaceae bacterium]|nr:hypothetical protein [Kofleriaceae bacterium]